MKKKKETIVIFEAHSDDFVMGAGGTIAKYAKQGKKIISIVFSYGERSHPWLKEKVVQDMRAQEAHSASKLLGCKTIFLGLKEGKFLEKYEDDKKIEKKLINVLEKNKPSKIFTHSNEDPHPDHKAINKITLKLLEKTKNKADVYIYSIWNPVSLKTKYPSLYEDISKTFSLKLKALKLFQSQRFNAIYPLMIFIFYRAIKNGLKIKKKFAEMFYKIR